MSEDTPTLNSVTALTGLFVCWVMIVTLTIIILQQWSIEGYFLDSFVMFAVMLFMTTLFLYLSLLFSKWMWQSARTILLNRDIVRTCRSIRSEWLKEFRK